MPLIVSNWNLFSPFSMPLIVSNWNLFSSFPRQSVEISFLNLCFYKVCFKNIIIIKTFKVFFSLVCVSFLKKIEIELNLNPIVIELNLVELELELNFKIKIELN
jgi:hypothetical protein